MLVRNDPPARLVGHRGGLDEYLPENLAAEKNNGSGNNLIEMFSPRNMATLCCQHGNVGGFHRAMIKAGRCKLRSFETGT